MKSEYIVLVFFKHSNNFTCDNVNFWTIVSLPTFILRVDKANLRSPELQPINLVTLNKAENIAVTKKKHILCKDDAGFGEWLNGVVRAHY